MAYNLLTVDDSATMRAMIIKTIHLSQVPVNQIFEAADGREGLSILENHWIDLVFADINMPEMNGIEMIERMNRHDLLQSIPVVVISTDGSHKRIEYLKSRGVREYIRKPFTPEQIRTIIFTILGVSHAQ